MKLNDARGHFARLRKDPGCIMIRDHCWKDYPERNFSKAEVLNLVMQGKATLILNKGDNPTPDSFHFMPKDDFGRVCKLVVTFADKVTGEKIIVISAFRRGLS